MKTKCLVIAHYNFVDKENRQVITTKAIASLGLYGFAIVCSPLLNDKELLTEVPIKISVKGNKFVIDNVG